MQADVSVIALPSNTSGVFVLRPIPLQLLEGLAHHDRGPRLLESFNSFTEFVDDRLKLPAEGRVAQLGPGVGCQLVEGHPFEGPLQSPEGRSLLCPDCLRVLRSSFPLHQREHMSCFIREPMLPSLCAHQVVEHPKNDADIQLLKPPPLGFVQLDTPLWV